MHYKVPVSGFDQGKQDLSEIFIIAHFLEGIQGPFVAVILHFQAWLVNGGADSITNEGIYFVNNAHFNEFEAF